MKHHLVVLVADDDPNDRYLLKHAVQRDGGPIDLHEVVDGTEFVQYMKGIHPFDNRNIYPFPDLVILDLKMPRQDGLQVLKWLRKQPEFRRLPTVMLSGSGLDRDVEAAYALGVNSYFSKPSRHEELFNMMHFILEYWSRAERPMAMDSVEVSSRG